MVKTHLVCYADEKMLTSQQLCIISAKQKAGIQTIHACSPFDFDKDFSERNKPILQAEQRGGGKGFWIFKPYFCEKVIRSLQDGDYLIYADSGVEFLRDINVLIDVMYRKSLPIMLFGNGHKHLAWCKHEVARWMLGTDNLARYHNNEQVQASVMIFQINDYTKEFCRRWLAWAQIPGMLDDELRGPQLQMFSAHRNDQSLLTNLAIADNLPLFWWPVQYGHHLKTNYSNASYPQMFYHHRFRESDWLNNRLSISQFMQLDKTK